MTAIPPRPISKKCSTSCSKAKRRMLLMRLAEAMSFADHGISFGMPEIDLDKLRGW